MRQLSGAGFEQLAQTKISEESPPPLPLAAVARPGMSGEGLASGVPVDKDTSRD